MPFKNLARRLKPYFGKALLSDRVLSVRRHAHERIRRTKKQGHVATVYLRINDPYSYLLIQALPLLQKRYPLQYDFRTILDLSDSAHPAPSRWADHAFVDAQFLGELYADLGLRFPKMPPTDHQLENQNNVRELTAQLLHWELSADFLDQATQLFHAYWHQDQESINKLCSTAVTSSLECYQHHLQNNQAHLEKHGHYQSAMIDYAGEWYWGLRRLIHLEERLNLLGLGTSEVFNRSHLGAVTLPELSEQQRAKLEGQSIDMYLSIRSPYSYLSLERAKSIADHYGMRLVLKPVLPMLMRRMQVPKLKHRYSIHDLKREAKRFNIPFGFIADPLGRGVENTYSFFDLASEHGKAYEFFLSVARGVWSENLDAAKETDMKIMVKRVNLSWPDAKQIMFEHRSQQWRDWAQANLEDLYALNHWGVPCFNFKDQTTFGQDSLDRLNDVIREYSLS